MKIIIPMEDEFKDMIANDFVKVVLDRISKNQNGNSNEENIEFLKLLLREKDDIEFAILTKKDIKEYEKEADQKKEIDKNILAGCKYIIRNYGNKL